MKVYKITAHAESALYGSDTSVHYLAAYSYGHACKHVQSMLENAGWTICGMSGETITVHDLRDSCDHTTDD